MTGYLAAMPPMSPEVAATIVALLRRQAGIAIPAEKTDLLRNRLARRLRALDLADFDAYAAVLAAPGGAQEIPVMVEALTTHTTSFFREARHYAWLAGEGLAAFDPSREVAVWSAACSTGAELWSAAMVLAESGRPGPWRVIGTDISRRVIARAEAAVYSEDEIAGVAEAQRRRFLLRSRDRSAGPGGRPLFRVAPELRERARFVQANLVALEAAPRIEADIVFLRNVLIYFDRPDQLRIVRGVAARVRDGGFLLTGHAEALSELPPGLRQVASSIYRKG